MTDTLLVIALVGSLASLAVAFASYRQSKKTSLALRREAIHRAQAAFQDVVDGNITTKTVDSIRESAELAELLFSNTVKAPLKRAQSAASRLQHTPSERQTDDYYKGKAKLGEDLDTGLDLMAKEAKIVSWPAWL